MGQRLKTVGCGFLGDGQYRREGSGFLGFVDF